MEKGQTEHKHIVRILNTDIDGNKSVYMALQKIKGISFAFSHAVLRKLNIDLRTKAGALTDEQIEKIQDILKNPKKNGFPGWFLNRAKDYESGEDIHLLGTDVKFFLENDIKRLQRIKSRRGLRHAWGLPVRGQRTKSNFRKNKGKPVGVKRKKVAKG